MIYEYKFYIQIRVYSNNIKMCTNKIKTLLVDDENSLLQQAKIFLERIEERLDVSTVSSAEEALEILDEERYEVIVSDYQMPDIDGVEFLEEIREGRDMDIPFIIFTGRGREEVAMKALNLGADRYIKKEGSPKDQFEFLAHAIVRENEQSKIHREKEDRERRIKELYEVSIELGNYDSEEKIYSRVLESFRSILDFQASSICMSKNGCLIVKATDAESVEEGEKRSNDEGIRGLTYQNQEPYLIDDLSNWEVARPSDPDFKSVLSIPIGDEGVFQALSYETNYFDEFDQEMSELLISQMWQVIKGIRYRNELKRNETWLSQIIKNSSIPTFVIDKDHTVTHWNQACENLTGESKETIVGTSKAWKGFYDEERPVMADLVLEEASREKISEYYSDKFGESDLLEEAFEAEDHFSEFGEEGRWVYFTAAPIKDSEGDRIGAIETLQDVTDVKESKERIKKNNEKIKKLHEKVSEFEKCETEKEICELVVQASERILEFEVCGIDFVEDKEFVPIAVSSDIEDGFIRRKVEDAGISRKVYQNKESLLVKDSRDIDFSKPVVSDYRSSITIPVGDFGIYQTLSTDVGAFDEQDKELAEILVNHATEAINRLRSEEELRKNKEKLEKLHQASAELEFCKSEEEVYDCAVEAAEKILDFDMCCFDAVEDDEFVVKATSSAVPDNGYANRSIEEGGTSRRTYLEQEPYIIDDLDDDDHAKPVSSDYRSIISLPLSDHGIFQAVSTEKSHFDEDDLKMAKLLVSHVTEALKRLESESRTEFLHSLLRHDVGNKAQLTQGYLQLLEEHDLQDEARELLYKAKRATEEGLGVIEKVRNLKEVEAEEERGEVFIGSMIKKVLLEHQAQLEERDIKKELGACEGRVLGGRLLEELFSNIIENILKHSRCSQIRVTSRTEGDECVISIEDDGEGIPDDIKDKVFLKGFKSGDDPGTGLGLYMVKEIAESYGGSVEVKDSELGGARFDVRLKRTD